LGGHLVLWRGQFLPPVPGVHATFALDFAAL